MRMRSPWFPLAAVVAMAIVAGAPAQAETYPSKPVKIVMATAAGSAPDVIARIVTDRLAQVWGKQVLILNRPGAGGLLAAQAVVSAEPDGYTLYLPSASSLVVLPETQKLPFDLGKDVVPIGIIGTQPFVIAVVPALGVNTLAELIALAKKRPGEIMYAGNFRGSLPNLTGELFRSRAGIDLTFVPYAGSAQAFQDVLAGRVPVVVEGLAALVGAVQTGVLKALAVTSLQRLANMPDVPTVAETIPGFEANGWFTLMAPAGTPAAIVRQASDDLRAVLAKPEVRERFETLGTYARPASAADTAAFIRGEQELWRPFVRQVGAPAQ